jgi:hypothetical protein
MEGLFTCEQIELVVVVFKILAFCCVGVRRQSENCIVLHVRQVVESCVGQDETGAVDEHDFALAACRGYRQFDGARYLAGDEVCENVTHLYMYVYIYI